MNKYKKLIKNSGLFAIANMGSSIISFLLVRFYTEFLTSEEYGTIDFIATTSSILIPFLTIAIVEAVLRFSMEQENKEKVLSNGLIVAFIGNIAFLLVAPLIMQQTQYAEYYKWMALLIFTTSVGSILAQYLRGAGQVTTFALYGVIKTLSLVTSNILLLAVFHLKIDGYLCSMVLSEFIGMVFLIVRGRLWQKISLQIDWALLKKMIIYALPLMPNSLSWWVMNASDKYMIVAFLGLSANGIYAVAHKIPSLINLCNGLFFQAWQLSAVEESNKKDTQTFYSNVFNMLAMFLLIIASMIFLFVKIIIQILVASSYQDVWKYTPFLVLSMVFSAFASFLGVNYVAMKKTNGALVTAIIGAVVNLIMNFCLIPTYGLNGAGFATMCGFIAMWISRAIATKDFVQIRYDYVRFLPALALLLVQAVSISSDWKHMLLCNMVCFIGVLFVYHKRLFEMGKRVCSIIQTRAKKT